MDTEGLAETEDRELSNIVELPVITKLDIPAERVIKAVQESDIQDIVVLGYLEDGEFYFASNLADGGNVLWLLETAKKRLMEIGEDSDER